MTSSEREIKVVSTHQAGRRWYRSWLRDPPRCWLLPPRCSGSLGPGWESARIRLSRQLCGWCGTYSHSPSTKSAITETKRQRRLKQCYEAFVTTFSLVAAANLCPYNWLALLLRRFGALWVLCYISEVGKHFTAWLYVLQAVLNTGSVLAGVAITCLAVALSPWKQMGISNHPHNPISAEAKCCHSQEAERSRRPTPTRVTKRSTHSPQHETRRPPRPEALTFCFLYPPPPPTS